MNWIRAHTEHVAVYAAALFLLLCSFFIWQNAATFSERFAALSSAPAPRPAGPLANVTQLQDLAHELDQPTSWAFGGRSGLFVPEKHFLDANGLPATLQSTELHPPVPNEWFEEHHLPITDNDVLAQDPDGDGFTNLDEWQYHTEPLQKDSHPEYLTKLKMKSFQRDPFRMVFASWVGDTFAINTTDLKEPTQFVKKGDTIIGTQFKIVGFAEKHEKNQYGTEVDVSELTLEQKETGEKMTLVKEKTAISPESVANFVYQWGKGLEFSRHKDQEFSLPPHDEIKYKLIDVEPAGATIVDTRKPDDRIKIGLLGR